MASLAQTRIEVASLLNDFCATIEMPPAQLTDSQRELVATLGFGMVVALSRQRKLMEPQIQILGTALLQDVFGYPEPDAIDFAAFLMRAAADHAVHPLSHGIIGLGSDAHTHWVDGDEEALSQVMVRLLDLVKAHTTAQ